MIDLKNREKYNFFSFFENDETEGTKLECLELTKEIIGEPNTEEASEMGHKYHIILVKDHKDDEDKFDHYDYFEAILCDPITYIEQMIEWNWYGVIVRKSTKSQQLVDVAIDNIQKVL
jgi:hypothetical protein